MIYLREGRDTMPRVDWTHEPPEDWREAALCAQTDGELWFPVSQGDSLNSRAAKRVCRQCPTAAACLIWALEQPRNPAGVWGATTERERLALRRRWRARHATRQAGAA